jgi:hypothetical protein
MKCEHCDGEFGNVCPECFISLENRIAFEGITPREMDALYLLGFVGEVDGDNEVVRIWGAKDNIIERMI